MKNNFPTLWTNNQAGFIALPILALILLGTAVVGGGGYTVYKVNQIEQKNAEVIADLQAKLEQVATTTQDTVIETATSTETATTTEDISTSAEVATESESEAKPAQVYTPPVTTTEVTAPKVVDVCSNIVGVQTSVPDGYKVSGTSCIPREDKCLNVEGIQDSIPTNMILSKEYGCITESDLSDIESEIAIAKKRSAEALEAQEVCVDAKDDLETVERAYNEAVDNLDDVSNEEVYSDAYMSAYEAFNKQKTKLNKAMIDAEVACGVYDFDTSSIQTTIEIPPGPIYTNCYYYGQGNIQCSSY